LQQRHRVLGVCFCSERHCRDWLATAQAIANANANANAAVLLLQGMS
jgi:hypothetical protein